MKLSFPVLALSIIVPSLAAVAGSTNAGSERPYTATRQQLSPPNPPRQPPEQVPDCRLSKTLPLSILCLTFVFKNDLWFERHFESEQKRDEALSKLIAFHHNRIVKQAEEEEACGKPDPHGVSSRIENDLRETRLLQLLVVLPSSNPKARSLDMLSGVGSFFELPLLVRQLLAARCLWGDEDSINRKIGTLAPFLARFHKAFDGFKDALLKIQTSVVIRACIRIVLGIDCGGLSDEDRGALLDSLQSLFGERVTMACSLHDPLSPSSTISALYQSTDSMHPKLADALSDVLQSSPEYATANWCMQQLKRPAFPWDHSTPHYHLLFNDAFLKRHGMAESDQCTVLRSCGAASVLWSLPPRLNDLNKPALVKWIYGTGDMSTLSPPDLVTLYSLDDALDAFSKYCRSLKTDPLLTFEAIALGVHYARYLSPDKRDALLKHLDPERLAGLDVSSKSDRKALAVGCISLLSGFKATEFVYYLSHSDFSLWAELLLDHPKKCKLSIWLDKERENKTARALVRHVGNDAERAANLESFPIGYRIKVFLLTEHDAVAECLQRLIGKEKLAAYVAKNFPGLGLGSHEEAARAARRAHSYRQS